MNLAPLMRNISRTKSKKERSWTLNRKKRKTSHVPRFVNEAAQDKFCDFAVRPIHIERPCSITENPYTDTIISYGWQLLTVAPQNCNMAIAREFYANASGMDAKDIKAKGVYVRGKYFKLSSQIVNNHYDLKDYQKDELSELSEVGNPDTVLKAVTLPGSEWVRTHHGHPKHVMLKNLTAEAKTWLLFINSRIMPMTHNIKIVRDRVYLIYALKNKLTVDFGKFVISHINHTIADDNQAMFFPHFLYEYAVKQGIRIAPSEDCKTSMGPIRDSHLRNYQQVEKAERERREEEARENQGANPEIEEIEEETEQQTLNMQPAQVFTNFAPIQNALADFQASVTAQHNSVIRHLDAMDERWGNFQTSVETRLDSMVQEHNSQWSEIEERLNQFQLGVHNLNLMMVYHHQSRGPNSYFPSMEELETQRMAVDTSRRVMMHGGSGHPGNSTSNFNKHPPRSNTSNYNNNSNIRSMNALFPGFSRFSTPPPPPGT